jgi:dinuclear metal center YbgI/SA1388 family protein
VYANGQTIIQWIERLAPKEYAVPEDKIGLQLGTLSKEVKKLLITLDITDAVIEEAISAGVDLIIAHHALIFRPLTHLRTDTVHGRYVEKLIKHDIAVYVTHTNLDVAVGGINDWLADAIGLTDTIPIEEVYIEKLYKLMVYVPQTHHAAVLEALFEAGAGEMGSYSHCSFSHTGVGTFRPMQGAMPYIGEIGQRVTVDEQRIEVIVALHLQKKVLQAMQKAHPYEVVAYDLYPIERAGHVYGLGRIGKLPQVISLEELALSTKQAYDVPMVRVVGNLHKPIRQVAVLGGSGGRYARRAELLGADAYITGDIDYHVAQDALATGFAIIDVGHHVEKIMKAGVATYLSAEISRHKLNTVVIASQVHTEPFQFI